MLLEKNLAMSAAGGAIASYTKALEFRNGKIFRRVTQEGYYHRAIASVECILIRSLEIVEGFGVWIPLIISSSVNVSTGKPSESASSETSSNQPSSTVTTPIS